jgi:long-chain acyl-CoA synthetase
MFERPWHKHYDYNVSPTIRYPQISVPELLQIPANALPDKPAIHFNGMQITFREYREMVLRMANALAGIGVGKGDRVGIQLPNCPQYLIAYYAALTLGAIVVNLNPAYTCEELTAISSDTGLQTLFALEEKTDVIQSLCSRVSLSRIILTHPKGIDSTPTGQEGNTPTGWYSFGALLSGCSDTRRPRVEVDTQDPAVIQFTGGTTGIPKGVVLSHANLVAAVMQVSPRMFSVLQFIPPERRSALVIIPLYYHNL